MRGCQALCCSSSPSFGAWISLREIKEIIVSNECEKLCPSVKTEDRGATTPGTQKTTTRAIQTFLVKGRTPGLSHKESCPSLENNSTFAGRHKGSGFIYTEVTAGDTWASPKAFPGHNLGCGNCCKCGDNCASTHPTKWWKTLVMLFTPHKAVTILFLQIQRSTKHIPNHLSCRELILEVFFS